MCFCNTGLWTTLSILKCLPPWFSQFWSHHSSARPDCSSIPDACPAVLTNEGSPTTAPSSTCHPLGNAANCTARQVIPIPRSPQLSSCPNLQPPGRNNTTIVTVMGKGLSSIVWWLRAHSQSQPAGPQTLPSLLSSSGLGQVTNSLKKADNESPTERAGESFGQVKPQYIKVFITEQG